LLSFSSFGLQFPVGAFAVFLFEWWQQGKYFVELARLIFFLFGVGLAQFFFVGVVLSEFIPVVLSQFKV
jgi:hypothetical protein